jgi:hypothetical protein
MKKWVEKWGNKIAKYPNFFSKEYYSVLHNFGITLLQNFLK